MNEQARQNGENADKLREALKKEKIEIDAMRAATWYGAVAQAPDHALYPGMLQKTPEEARKLALKQCAQDTAGKACRLVADLKNQCFAVAAGASGDRFFRLGAVGVDDAQGGKVALRACGEQTQNCKVLSLVCSTGTAAVAKYREEQSAEAKPVLNAMSQILGPLWQQRPQRSVLPEGGPSSSLPLINSEIYPVGAATVKKLLSLYWYLPEDGPSLTAGGPNLRTIVLEQMSAQKFLYCTYDRNASENLSFAFWTPTAPSNIQDLLLMDVDNNFIFIGANALTQCPATYGQASALQRDAVVYMRDARFTGIRKAYKASKDAQGRAPPGQTVESLQLAAHAQAAAEAPVAGSESSVASAGTSVGAVTPVRADPNPPIPQDPRQRQCAVMWENVDKERAKASGFRAMIGVRAMENSTRRQCGERR